MSSKVDLPGCLDQVEDSLRGWLAGDKAPRHQPPEKPCQVRAWYTLPGGSTREVLSEFELQPDAIDPGNVRARLEADLVERLGSNPLGTLKIKIWPSGSGAFAPVDITRKLTSLEEADGSPSLQLTQRVMYRNAEQAERAWDHVRMSNEALAAALGTVSNALANASTQRAVSSSAADMGGPWGGVLGLLGMLIGYPLVNRLMRERPQLLSRLEKRIMDSLEEGLTKEGIKPPPGAALLVEDGDQHAEAAAAAAGDNGDDVAGEISELSPLEQLLRDPAKVAKLEILAQGIGVDLVEQLAD